MSRVSRAFRLTGKFLKFIVGLIVFAVIFLLIWRVFSSNNPKEMEALTPNDKLARAYEEKGDSLRLFYQDLRSITSGEDDYGYFSATDRVFIPDANQVQLLFRYNNSTIRAAESDFELESTPSREEDLFDVTLLFAIDLTPENSDDNFGNDEESVKFIRVHADSHTSGEKNIYNFRRFVFDLDSAGLDMDALMEEELLLAVYVDVYYNGAIDYDKTPYSALCIYEYTEENIEIKHTKERFEALETYGE